MAAGIVSIAARENGFDGLSLATLFLAAVAYLALAAAAIRVFRRRDPTSPLGQEAITVALTFVAASAVLGSRLDTGGVVGKGAGLAFWIIGAVALLAIASLAVSALWRLRSRFLPANLSGSAMLLVVAPQSLAVLGVTLAALSGTPWLAIAIFLWLLGLLLYPAVAAGLAGRVARNRFGPRQFTPDYWIVMGALAITVVAATTIHGAELSGGRPADLSGLLEGAAEVGWVAASAAIAPLLAAEVWRARRVGLDWASTRWSMVFPLGMYAVASHQLARVWPLPALMTVGAVAQWVAVAALTLTIVATARARAASWVPAPRKGPRDASAGGARPRIHSNPRRPGGSS